MFLHLSVSHSVHGGVPGPGVGGGCLVLGKVSAPGGGVLAWSGGAWSRGVSAPGGLVQTPPDGYCCGRYASYWNAFLLCDLKSRVSKIKSNLSN